MDMLSLACTRDGSHLLVHHASSKYMAVICYSPQPMGRSTDLASLPLRSARFALRPWLYILLHALVAAPAAWLQGGAPGAKVAVFGYMRTALGAASAGTEALLYR